MRGLVESCLLTLAVMTVIGPDGLTAQTVTPALCPAAVRPDDALVFVVDGPERLRLRLLATDVGTTVETLYGEHAWRTAHASATGFLVDNAPDEPTGLLVELLADLIAEADRIVVSTSLANIRFPNEDDAAVFAVKPRRGFDAAARIDGFRNSLAARGVEFEAVAGAQMFETDWRPGPGSPRVRVALHASEDDGWVTLVAGASEVIERRLKRTHEQGHDRALYDSVLGFRITMDGLVRSGREPGERELETMRELGVATTSDYRMLVQPAGPRIEVECSIGFTEEGPTGWLATAANAAPLDLGAVVPNEIPERIDSWVAFHIDFSAWFRGLIRSLTSMFNGFLFSSPKPLEPLIEERMQEVTEEMLGDPFERYFDKMSGDCLLGFTPPDPSDHFIDPPSVLFSASLEDAEGFERNLKELGDAAGELDQVLGAWEVHGDRLLMAWGVDQRRLIASARAPRTEPDDELEPEPVPGLEHLPAAVRHRIEAPAGASAVGELAFGRWVELIDDLSPLPQGFDDLHEHIVDAVLPALRERGLDRIGLHVLPVSAESPRLRARLRW